ncbi:11927_t:CDS:2 [Gigaspora margarita]|uniref:11927_t:CDS:1 n=1 Tax=Gigaspora margarita TaxID=4874 RepID=A0ABM8W4X2_GIGMA|nr:11927_t:CDS:2 [Gigaspora margarita]
MDDKGVRNYYDDKSAKHSDGNKNIGENPLKEKKRPFAANLDTSQKVAEFTNKMQQL